MTYEEIERAGFVPLRTCSICATQIGYLVHPELAAVVFNSACGCGSGEPNYRLIDRAELASIATEPKT
jgi:hypothetical protein